ncbi:hypothetical protein [Comamonas endophytica]|uniref:Uncharacterized protein n=2 Tax=Comamonas endophytica TaxID=2949090 RepID=A0ABY6GDP0_9BURK|nr:MULTISPECIES: hypothetical protein [unclassified Acidovorax]MCD2513570.1 hypothetical protein [Acidovorax sp. D4N7]UYG52420.1 hypothetical protein M9799_04030 [Acidovorax sp. 5MLIR]
MLLYKTPKAHQELAPGSRSLNLRQRSLLLLAEGTPYPQLAQMYHGQGEALVAQLLHTGYLASRTTDASTSCPAPSMAPAAAPASMTLAGTRMYLFDMVERLFAHRQQALAEQLRQALREARDGQALRSVCDQLLNAVATHAGAQRAAQLSQQLVPLVPDWSLESHEN